MYHFHHFSKNFRIFQKITIGFFELCLLEQKLGASNLAHRTALDELDLAQKQISSELQKIAKLQAERRSFLTLREEIEVEKDARRDLANENNFMKEQLERVVKADQTGSQVRTILKNF